LEETRKKAIEEKVKKGMLMRVENEKLQSKDTSSSAFAAVPKF